ncbi:MAG: hypothetical protein ABJN14_07745 [Paracoccaceae bacterium]
MVDTPNFDTPILKIYNENDKVLDVLIEPHLELFELPPGASCDVLYSHAIDNTDVNRMLEVAHRDDCMVVYSPGEYAPELWVDGVRLKNKWG